MDLLPNKVMDMEIPMYTQKYIPYCIKTLENPPAGIYCDTFLLLEDYLFQHVSYKLKFMFCFFGAVKPGEFSFSIPLAFPGTDLPVSSSQTQLRVPRWPLRRSSSPAPAAWDHISSGDADFDRTACPRIIRVFF